MTTRFDSVGLWWEDFTNLRKNRSVITLNVPPPVTGWLPPTEFPNLSGVKVLGLDTETKDLELLTRGPGAVRGAAHVVGVSIATEDAAWYFPLRHEYESERHYNQSPDKVLTWLGDQLQRPVPIVGANLLYDLEVLRAANVPAPRGELFDVQYAQPLLDEEARSYSLDTLAQQYLGRGKETPLLYEWCSQCFGGNADGKQRANIYRSPPSLVGPYAEADARLPLQILAHQRRLLAQQDLTDLFRMECGLIPLLLDMRFRGVRVDLARAREASKWLRNQAREAQSLIPQIDVWSPQSVATAFDRAGIKYPRTDAGNPSFTRAYLEGMRHHPLAQAVLDVRLYEKAANPFVESYLLNSLHGDRVHCQFHPLRSDDFGTVSGRLSSSNPNLQNIPSRHKVIGPLLRGLFIPEEGCVWRRQDYSQIEYRGFAHYAVGEGGVAIRNRYLANPDTDFHQMTIDMVHEYTDVVLARTPAKNLNFGLIYGMGKEKTIHSLGVTPDMGERLYDAYFLANPAAKKTYRAAERLAKRRGYIRTLLRRRRRFPNGDFAHKALNALLQGTAADIMKKAMFDIYRAGLTLVLGPPHLTVHDELDWSDPQTKQSDEAFREVERIMVECVQMRVPLRLDVSTGPTWGACK